MGKVKDELEKPLYLTVQRRRRTLLATTYREGGKGDAGAQVASRHDELSTIDIMAHCDRSRGYRFFIYRREEGFLCDFVIDIDIDHIEHCRYRSRRHH